MLFGITHRGGRLSRAHRTLRQAQGGAVWLLAAVIAMAFAAGAAAQETRSEEITKKQEEKARQLAPYKPSRFEAVMNRLEENFASPPSGFYPAFGSVYPGGGLTLGVGYRQFYARKAVFDITGLYSIKNYKQIEVSTRSPWNFEGPVFVALRGGWLDAPQIGYFGLGMDSSSDDRANFRLSQGYGGVTVSFRPGGWTRFEADVAYEDVKTDSGTGRAPSIETRYDSITAPGLFTAPGEFSNPKFVHSQGTVAIDWRTSPGYSRKGGYYGVTFVDYKDVDDVFSFQRVDGELIQHIPILRENWVISLRGRVQSTVDNDDLVPYYLLPYLGSGRTLRAYSTGRFRDKHSILTSAELRWIPSRLALDMALFYDAGKVTARREDLDLNGLESDWGIGARFHGPTTTVLRIEAAKGKEGWHLVFTTNAAF
jgi:hypothetical protein